MAQREHRVAGALIGSVVGDALGAPFEVGPPGQFSARFPRPARGVRTEMCGGGPWAPGEWTDDTQMGLLVAHSLLDCGGLDESDMFHRFCRWAQAGPTDIGVQTAAVLRSGLPFDQAAAAYFGAGNRAAGNGSLMRTTPAAIWFSRFGAEATADAARRISRLTHGDPAAGEGCAIFHQLLRVALDGDDPLEAVDAAVAGVPEAYRAKWAAVLAPTWHPERASEGNGAVWPTLGSAVWALRTTTSFEEAMRAVIDLGGDTDTVAAVTGGLVGAVQGIARIPMRWTSAVHGGLPGFADRAPGHLGELHVLARRLDGRDAETYLPPPSDQRQPAEVASGVWAADLAGAQSSDDDFAVISLCRTGGRFGHEVQRLAFLVDDDSNEELADVLDDVLADMAALRGDGKRVLVHCYAGRSRTGLVLRAWMRRTEGMSPAEATAYVRERWPWLGEENESFTRALAAY